MFVEKKPFIVHKAAGDTVSPVVFDNPHSGRVLPLHFRFNCDEKTLDVLSDLHTGRLLADVPAGGIPVLEQKIHRTVIDTNRYESEIDPAQVNGPWPEPPDSMKNNIARGLGLIPAFVAASTVFPGKPMPEITPIYNDNMKPTPEEIRKRIAKYHRPYYKSLASLLRQARQKNGFSVLVNTHSMIKPYDNATDVILGDLDGVTCAPLIRDFVSGFFTERGFTVSCNAFFKGGSIIQRFSGPQNGVHAIQIELDRELYMDMETHEYLPEKAARLKTAMTALADALDKFTRDHAASLRPASPNTSPNASHSASSTAPKPRS